MQGATGRRLTVVSLLALLLLVAVAPWRVLAYSPAWSPLTPRPKGSAPSLGAKPLRKFTLAMAIRVALKNNPGLRAQRLDEMAQRGRVGEARAAGRATLALRSGYTRYRDDQRLVPGNANFEPGVYSAGLFSADLALVLPLYTGGRVRNDAHAARLGVVAAAHRSERTRSELVFDVTRTFYAILAQRKVIASLTFSQKALASHLKRVGDLVAAGKAPRVDRLRTEVRLAVLKEGLVRETNVLSIGCLTLNALLGLTFECAGHRAKGELPAAEGHGTAAFAPSLVSAFEHRSDYLAAKAALGAQQRRLASARGGLRPTVSLVGAYGNRMALAVSDQPPGTEDSRGQGQVGLSVELPFFDGGRTRGRVRRERATFAAARERLRQLELRIRLEVGAGLLNMRSSAKRAQATAKSIEQGRESLRIERAKYERGKGSITDVLDAQSALLQAQTNHYRALADLATARAQLRLAMGEKGPSS